MQTSLSSFRVTLTLKCVFIPMSSLCRAKMPLYSTIVSSRFYRLFPVMSESIHLNIARNFFRVCSFSFGSSFSSSANSRSSFKIRFCVGEYSSVFPGFSGVGNQNFSSLSLGRSTCNLHKCVDVCHNIVAFR